MNPSSVYRLLCFLGTLLPLYQLIPWIISRPLGARIVGRFFVEVFSTRIGGFFGMDVIVSAVVLFAFIHLGGRNMMMGLR